MSNKVVNILFGATIDFLPQATVTAISVFKNLKSDITLRVYFLYANIVNNYDETLVNNYIDTAQYTFDEYNIEFIPINVKEYMHMFEKQNYGMWGKAISMTHYIYLLAPLIIKNEHKVIYLDTDMIVNSDLEIVYDSDMGNCLLGMGAPRGMEDMGEDVSNSGFIVLNLDLWRKENTLSTLIEFGEKIPRGNFCDQNLLYQYFTKQNPDRLYLFDKEYNIFPQLFEEIAISDIKILHYTGWKNRKPWSRGHIHQRASYLWWKYARLTAFYEHFIMNDLVELSKKTPPKKKSKKKTKLKPKKLSIGEQIFSIRNSEDKKHKILKLLNLKIKIRKR